MNKIEAVDMSYDTVIDSFQDGRERIPERIRDLLIKVQAFLETITEDTSVFYVSDRLVTHVVMDYFTDIERLKKFHSIERTNRFKILAYELYWWLKRKPIQIIGDCTEDLVFVNEKFATSLIIDFFSKELQAIKPGEGKQSINSFIDTLYYYFKYRHYTAQDIEIMLLAFQAGSYTNYIG